MRPIPATIRETLERSSIPDALLAFLTIEHENLPEPILAVSDVLDYVWRGHVFQGVPFGFRLASDNDAAPTAELRVKNVDRVLGEAVRRLPGRARIRVELLSSADFDLTAVPRTEIGTATPIYAMRHFELIDVTGQPIEVTGTVMLRDYAQEPWPGVSATASRCPGLFR
ncbi:DUF1833 family protein [Rhodovulum steppense]|uniref:Uncharacterized protein DUF1833 n=1 Tax=Rhodovulum steppense TaxID=540251 RepID=A0A4R1YV38_9RHOB|nr:DUF1833 family protein [Rhodovulum steppense]TCM84776.1 uncharacterized protein DUF1833 [Rhodovulum steppense]